MKTRKPVFTKRQQAILTAKQAEVPLDEWDRAQVLGQIAGLIAAHPKVGGMIAFKGGAIMHLIDKSPRFSKDLDGALIAGGKVTQEVIREALTSPAAKRVVISVGELVSEGAHSIIFPVIVCHPLSGKGRIALQLSVNWQAPLLRKPERKNIPIHGRTVSFLVVARIERISEKVRAFLMRGRAGDAFDLYHYAKQGISDTDRANLPALVARKLAEDDDVPSNEDLKAQFDARFRSIAKTWLTDPLVIRGNRRPSWDEVGPRVQSFKRYVPGTKPKLGR